MIQVKGIKLRLEDFAKYTEAVAQLVDAGVEHTATDTPAERAVIVVDDKRLAYHAVGRAMFPGTRKPTMCVTLKVEFKGVTFPKFIFLYGVAGVEYEGVK